MARKFRPRKTARRHKRSTAGKIFSPLDVRSDKVIGEFKKRITQGPLTIIMVYADWCGHCHTMKPHFDTAANNKGRSIQAVKVQDVMLPAVNAAINKGINKSAKPINVEGYPSIVMVDKQGNVVTDVEPIKNTKTMINVMNQAGPLAEEAKLSETTINEVPVMASTNNYESIQLNNKSASNKALRNSALRNSALRNSALRNSALRNTNKNKKPSLAALGAEEVGLAEGASITSNTSNIGKNSYVGEDKMKGSIASLATPPSQDDLESISYPLTPAQKVGGGLYSIVSQTAYQLAPAAILLASASSILKRRHNKSYRKVSKHHRRTKRHSRK